MGTEILPRLLGDECFTCPVCRGLLNNPKVLPCFHMVCEGCLTDHVTRSAPVTSRAVWILCPQCRDIIETPESGLSGFPSLSSMKRVMQDFGVTSQMTKHEKQAELGENGHGEKPEFSLTSQEKEELLYNGCCRKADTRVFCGTCKCVCCKSCIQGHVMHDIITTAQGSRAITNEITSLSHDVRTDLNVFNAVYQDSLSYKAELDAMKREALSQITTQAVRLRALLDYCENLLKEEVINSVSNCVSDVDVFLGQLQSDIALLKTLDNIITVSLNKAPPDEMIYLNNKVQKSRDTIMNIIGRMPEKMAKTSVRFETNDQTSEAAVKCLFGDIRININNTNGKSAVQNSNSVKIEGTSCESKNNNRLERLSAEQQLHEQGGKEDTLYARITPSTITSPSRLEISSFEKDSVTLRCDRTLSAIHSFSTVESRVTGLACLANDEMLIVDQNSTCVKFLRGDGIYKKILGSESIFDVGILDDQTLVVSDKTVHLFDTRGRLLGALHQQPRDSRGIACSSDGVIYLVNKSNQTLYLFRHSKSKKDVFQYDHFPLPISPSYVATDSKGNVAVSSIEDGGILLFNIVQDLPPVVLRLGDDVVRFNEPSGVHFDSEQNLYICDKGNNRIVVVNLACDLTVSVLNTDISWAKPVAVTSNKDGHLVVAEENGRIRVLK